MKKLIVLFLTLSFVFAAVSCSDEKTLEEISTQNVSVQQTIETPQEEVPVEKFSWDDFGTIKYPYGEIVGVSKTNVRTVVKITSTTFEEYKSYIDLLKENSFVWRHEYEDYLEESVSLDEVMKTSFWTGENQNDNTFITLKFFDNDSISHTNYNVIMTYYNRPIENEDY